MPADKRKIVLAFDSFKGSLASLEVADAFAEGFSAVAGDCTFVKLPVADGGEGTVEALVAALGGEFVKVAVHGPLDTVVEARYGVVGENCAVVEMAAASGLTLLAEEERNPWMASTYGTGELIAHAIERGCRRFLVGIGGSATNDGGVGMLRALGYRFFDSEGRELAGGGNILGSIVRIDASNVNPALFECDFSVACDVDNPLFGERGAAFVFAAQKGADEAMIHRLDEGLRNYARVVKDGTGIDVSLVAGAGAAGGLGAAFVAFLGAHLVPGVDMVLDALRFGDVIDGASLVVTGEGCIDRQTVMGKAPCGVLRVARLHGVPVVAVGGAVKQCEEVKMAGFAAVYAATPAGMSLSQAMEHAVAWENVRRCASLVAVELGF